MKEIAADRFCTRTLMNCQKDKVCDDQVVLPHSDSGEAGCQFVLGPGSEMLVTTTEEIVFEPGFVAEEGSSLVASIAGECP